MQIGIKDPLDHTCILRKDPPRQIGFLFQIEKQEGHFSDYGMRNVGII